MADPRIQAPMQRNPKRSPLMEAQASTTNGDIVNACQFGCETEDLDDKGFCRHMVGFADPKIPGMFHPQTPRYSNDGDEVISVFTDGSNPQKLLQSDVQVRVTNSLRVYRDVDRYPPKWLPKRELIVAGAGDESE